MFSANIAYISGLILSGPIFVGMIIAFFCGRKRGQLGAKTEVIVWAGYRYGILSSVALFGLILFVFCIYLVIDNKGKEAADLFAIVIVMSIIFTLFSSILGLILYTPCAFFGVGIGRQIFLSNQMEINARKTREELEAEQKLASETKPHLQ